MPKSSGSLEINFADLLLIVFIILKLTRVIAWSWWWVLVPLWFPVLLALGVVILLVILKLAIR